MTRRILITIAVSFAIISACGASVYYGYKYWVDGRFIERTDNAYVRSNIVSIAPKVSGYIVEVAVTDNQRVKAGDLLFRIDPADFEARRAQSRAALDAAKAARTSLDEERMLQGSLIDEARAGISAARAEAKRAARDRKRTEDLAAKGWAPRQSLELAIATETRARAGVEQAEAALAARRQRLGVLTAEARRLDAVIDQMSAQLRLAEIAIDDTVVLAPVDGIVGNRHVAVGHYARPGVPLLSIVPLHDVWVVANFKEKQLARMMPGQAARIHIDAIGGSEYTGYVESLAPASGAEFSLLPPDNATGNFVRIVQRIPVKIILEGDFRGRLRPGMSANVRVDTRSSEHPELTR